VETSSPVRRGKKDTGYLYKALMVARRASPAPSNALSLTNLPNASYARGEPLLGAGKEYVGEERCTSLSHARGDSKEQRTASDKPALDHTSTGITGITGYFVNVVYFSSHRSKTHNKRTEFVYDIVALARKLSYCSCCCSCGGGMNCCGCCGCCNGKFCIF